MQRTPHPDSWLAAHDFDSEGTELTVTKVSQVEIEPGKTKSVVFFKETPKGLVLNEINLRTIARNLGEDSFEKWVGCKVRPYATTVTVRESEVPCVRIKISVGKR